VKRALCLLAALAASLGCAHAQSNRYCAPGNVSLFPSDGPAAAIQQCWYTPMSVTPATGSVVSVSTAGALTTALAAAACGQRITLAAGASFSGNFTIPAVNCAPGGNYLWIVSSGAGALPGEGLRVSPCYAGVTSLPGRPAFNCPTTPGNYMAQIITPNSTAALTFTSGFSGVRFIGIEVTKANGVGHGPIITANPGNHLLFDRSWLHGTEAGDETANGLPCTQINYCGAIDSYFSDFYCIAVVGTCTDAHAVFAGNSTSSTPDEVLKVVDDYLEASGENFFSGGGASSSNPNDIEVRQNTMLKPLVWNPSDPSYTGGYSGHPVIAKNLFELKSANRVFFEGNQLYNSWAGFSQDGLGLNIDAKNQSGANVSITSFTGTSGTLTFSTATVPNVGESVTLGSGAAFAAPNTGLNNQTVTVASTGSGTFSAVVTGSGYASGAGSYGGNLCPVCAVTNVIIRYSTINTVNVIGVFSFTGNDNGVVAAAQNHISVHDLVADNIGYSTCYLCTTTSVNIGIAESDTAITASSQVYHDLVFQHVTSVNASGAPAKLGALGLSGMLFSTGFEMYNITFTNNLVLTEQFGTENVIGNGAVNCAYNTAHGSATIAACWNTSTVGGNCFVANGSIAWPATNVTSITSYPAVLTSYNSGNGGNYAVLPGACKGAGLDHLDPGANLAAVAAAINGVTPPSAVGTTVSGLATLQGQAILAVGPGIIPASLFGLHFRFNENQQEYGAPCPTTVLKYPNLPYGSLRLWDTDTRWQNLNLAAGTFNFACLDPYLAVARTAALTDLVMTLSSTPTWAASNPSVNDCDYSFFSLGDCSPPDDLNADGTGTNQHWRDYLYALGTHIAALNAGTYMAPTYFEMWNEFTRGSGSTNCTESNGQQSWLGTCEQLVRMAQDANCILTGRAITITATATTCTAAHMNEPAIGLLPQAQILTPNAASNSTPDINLWGDYVATTGALLNVDRLAVHAYADQGLGTTVPDGSSFAGTFVGLPAQYSKVESLLPAAAFGKRLWSTEGSWASTPINMPDANMQEGYVARYYLAGWSAGFRELYWYAVNNSYGTLINQNGVNGCSDGGTQLGCPTQAATGWSSIYGWMVGNQLSTPCAADAATGNIWTCGLLKTAGAVQQQAVWDASQGSAAVTVTVTTSGGSCAVGTPCVQATLMNGSALSAATNWTTVPIPAGSSYISFSAKPGWGFLLVTGLATITQPNDTLLLSDPFHVVSAGSGISGEITGNSFYSYSGAYTKYYTLDSGSGTTPLAGGTVAIGWKPILLSQ